MHDQVCHYTGGYLVRETEIVREDLWVKNGKIIDPETVNYRSDKCVDMLGKLIAPGFIDLKLNGAFGVDFSSELTKDNVKKVTNSLPAQGVTSFYPCVTSVETEAYGQILPVINSVLNEQSAQLIAKEGAEILGLHLDGPLHNNAKKGHVDVDSPTARKAAAVTTIAGVEQLYGSFEGVKIVSIAPEHEGAITSIIPGLTDHGVKVSLAHTSCTIEEAEAAVNAGANLIGHLFNGMPNFHHRDPSLVGVLASTEINHDVHFGLIADLVHVHPSTLAMAQKLKADSLMLTSDGISALGLLEEQANSHGVEIRRTNSLVEEAEKTSDSKELPIAAYEPGTNHLIGSVTPLIDAVKNLLQYTDATLLDGINAVTARPARAMGLDKKGSLLFGHDADFVSLDNNLNILATYTKGALSYSADETAELTKAQPIVAKKISQWIPEAC